MFIDYSIKVKPSSPSRILDAIPGFLIVISLVFCVLMAIFAPETLMIISALLAIYAMVRFIFVGLASVRGLHLIREWERRNWSTDAIGVHHIVIIPNYNEPLAVLRRTLDNIAQSPDAHRMSVMLAMEQAEQGSIYKAEILQAEYRHKFCHVFYTLHPVGLPGEMQCKSANQSWAIHWVKHELVDRRGYDLDSIIVTTMDADTLWHQQYFSALTQQFMANSDRHRTFWQAPIRYHANIYEINPIMRCMNVYTTATELAYLRAEWWQSLPISSYSLSLRLLHDAGYWDTDVIADEWHMYIKSFFAKQGEIKLQPIYLPFSASIVTGDTLLEAFRNRYKQTLRHAWGSKEIGYTIAQMLKHNEFRRSIPLLSAVAHDLLLSSAGWIILTFGSQLPLLLHAHLRDNLLSYPPFWIMQTVSIVLFVLGMILLILDIRTRPPRPYPATFKENLLVLFGFLMLPIFGILFIILPMFHAQIRLLFGKGLRFQVTEKA